MRLMQADNPCRICIICGARQQCLGGVAHCRTARTQLVSRLATDLPFLLSQLVLLHGHPCR